MCNFLSLANRGESKGIESGDKKSIKKDKRGERLWKGETVADKPRKLRELRESKFL